MLKNAGLSPKPRLRSNKRSVLSGWRRQALGFQLLFSRRVNLRFTEGGRRGVQHSVSATGGLVGLSGLSARLASRFSASIVMSAIVLSLTRAEEKLAQPN